MKRVYTEIEDDNVNEKRLLILGSVEDFTRLAKYAVERGIYTVVADAYAGEAKKYATKSYEINLNDDDLLDQICRFEKIDHVISSFSDNLFEKMVLVSERNGLPCFCSAEKVRYLRDKVLMKEMFRALDIKTARGKVIDCNSIEDSMKEFRFPCVIKPLDGWGSKGMKIVYSSDEAKNFAMSSAKFSTTGYNAMVEELNEGHEINVMSWIKNGKVHLLEFGDRETSGRTNESLPYLSREVFPSFFYKETKERVIEYLRRIAEFIGIKEGPLSMQFFYNNEEIIIGEAAGRFFGLGQGIVPVINNIELNQLLINSIYFPEENERILENENKELDHVSIAIYLKAKKGVVRDVGNAQLFMNENVDEFRLFATPGQSTTFIPWILRVYAHFNTREEADAYTRNLYKNLFVPDLNGENLVAPNVLVKYGE